MVTTAKIAGGANLMGYLLTLATESHKFQDFSGTLPFGLASVATLMQSKNYQATRVLLTSCVCIWSLRLSGYLLYRITQIEEDDRMHTLFPNRDKGETWFRSAKVDSSPKIGRLTGFWLYQTLWCIVGLAPVYMAHFSDISAEQDATGLLTSLKDSFRQRDTAPIMDTLKDAVKHNFVPPDTNTFKETLKDVSPISWAGFASFALFFIMETVADWQKYVFKSRPENANKFINTGLYRYCQFPNYFAEIGIWSSIWLAASPLLKKNDWWTVASPLFVLIGIRFVSGIPTLERQWDKKYARMPEFQRWRRNTNKLIPWFPKDEDITI